MKREDFIFTIGYRGEVALVDKSAISKYGKLSTRELADAGLLKAAFCSSIYDNMKDSEYVLEVFNDNEGFSYKSVETLKRVFGVFSVPDESIKVKYL